MRSLLLAGLLLAGPSVCDASFNSTFKLKVYERGEGDEPSHVIGFTPLRAGKSIDLPSASRWYVRPIGSLDHEGYYHFLKEAQEKKIPGLDLSSRWDVMDEDLAPLEDLKHLRTLFLAKTRITDEGLPAIARIKNLRVLELNNHITNKGLPALKPLEHLEELTLTGAKISDKGLQELLPALTHLKRLNISETSATDAALSSLKAVESLRILVLPMGVTDSGTKSLATLKSLQELDVSHTTITDKGLKNLAPLTQLRALYMNKRLTDTGAQALTAFKKLEKLDVSGCALTHTALSSLIQLKNLKALALTGTRITDAGLPLLAGLPDLETLELSNTKISHGGLAMLAGAKNLVTLSLSWQRLTEEDVLNLAAFPKLEEVILNGTPLPQSVFEQLKSMTLLKQKKRPIATTAPQPKTMTPVPAATSVPAKPLPQEILRVQPLKGAATSASKPTPSSTLAPAEIPLGAPVSATNLPGVIFQQKIVKEAPGAPQLTGLRRVQQIQADQNSVEDVTAASAAPSLKDPYETSGPGMDLDIQITPSKKKKK